MYAYFMKIATFSHSLETHFLRSGDFWMNKGSIKEGAFYAVLPRKTINVKTCHQLNINYEQTLLVLFST